MSNLAVSPLLNAYSFVGIYVNTLLCVYFTWGNKERETDWVGRYYRVGIDRGNRIAGFLLATATAGLLIVGAGPIAFLRKLHCLHILPS